MKFTTLTTGLIVTTALLAPVSVLAGHTAANNSDWSYAVTPYVWAAGQKGKVATLPPAPPVDIDVPISDIVDNLDMAFMGIFEAHKGRLGLFTEIFYTSISADTNSPDPSYSKIKYEQDLLTLSFGASYSVSQSQEHNLDVIGGIRFWDLDNSLKLTAGLSPETKVSEHESWQDPFIGMRSKVWLNPQWTLLGWGIVSVAGDSDSAFDLFAAVGYEYSDAVSFTAGYRHIEVDYDHGDFLYDVEISGPIIGGTFRF